MSGILSWSIRLGIEVEGYGADGSALAFGREGMVEEPDWLDPGL